MWNIIQRFATLCFLKLLEQIDYQTSCDPNFDVLPLKKHSVYWSKIFVLVSSQSTLSTNCCIVCAVLLVMMNVVSLSLQLLSWCYLCADVL